MNNNINKSNNVKDFILKHLSNYYGIYVLSDTLFIANIFEKVWIKCNKTYALESAHFLSPSWLTWQACLKKIEI